ncbi:ribosomal protein S8e [Methanoregula boonei 6A8]|jgi:small subunit ribosomal protein S8e|uniref:Small ribosomal subunit protein eS8 n=1 Tax=Methanoregula boonei (strain DSM 21154 / JCM 14090 / 6A8) TaxID=456442 RepID=RS8E_METB6|nr:30S ribosomal protein S8e [Methanoregula boonei]A7IAR0.1 RecName: Full=Small ribosomal subunit protein eS8; AltName: Full=30S ribosomal protein S8e [Methanoregula boonei 6A8]ABS56821.1 ribosomal protein S8e [Methanoregula boonei 6A8]
MLWQGESIRKVTGGRRRPAQGKRRFEIGLAPADTHIGEDRSKLVRTTGGNTKIRSMRAQFANVTNLANGETKKVKIENVEENGANPNYVRRNLLTKGAIIRTEIGRARIMSRPGQDGIINAVLLA